jgi:toxin ParE1/3/4
VTWRLVLESQAEAEILQAAEWYGRRNNKLRDDFLSAITSSLIVIQNNPLQYQPVRGEVRRIMVGRFPYALLYSVSGEDVIVTVCFHCSRDPKRWRERFPS